MARCLWNLNSVSSGGVASSSLMTVAAVVMCLLLACSAPVLGDNYNNAQDYNNRLRSGAYCEDLSAQKFIEMDHVRIEFAFVQTDTGGPGYFRNYHQGAANCTDIQARQAGRLTDNSSANVRCPVVGPPRVCTECL